MKKKHKEEKDAILGRSEAVWGKCEKTELFSQLVCEATWPKMRERVVGFT